MREARLMVRTAERHSLERALYDPLPFVNPTQMKTKLYTLKGLVLCVFVFLISGTVIGQQVAKTIPYAGSPTGIIGFLQFTPSDYGSQKHPLIIFMHGTGERGNGTTDIQNVTANGIPNLTAHGASMRFTVGGVTLFLSWCSARSSTLLSAHGPPGMYSN